MWTFLPKIVEPLDFIQPTGKSQLQSQIDENSKQMARLSNESYKTQRSSRIDGYNYDPQLSTNNAAVYHDNKGQPVIAFRGTSTIDDLATDMDVALGLSGNKRFRESEQLVEQVQNKYNKKPRLTGHSLGGSLASHISKKGGNDSVIFNPGTSILSNIVKQNTPKNVIVHRTRGDLVSGGFAQFGANGSLLGTATSHSLSSFL